MKKIGIALIVVVIGLGSFVIGMHWMKNKISRSAEEMEATLSFSHWKNYRRIRDDVSSGCISRAIARLNQAIEEQEMLMAEYVQGGASKKFERYIELRNDRLLQRLRDYEVDWGKEWQIPACEASG